jgi:hypothetical protein
MFLLSSSQQMLGLAGMSTAIASPAGLPKQRDAAASIGYMKWIVGD